MNINFSIADEACLNWLVEQGYYKTKTDAVEDAVRQMRRLYGFDHKAKHANFDFYAAIRKGDEQTERGEYVELTAETFEQIRKDASENVKNGIISHRLGVTPE